MQMREHAATGAAPSDGLGLGGAIPEAAGAAPSLPNGLVGV